MPAEYEDKTIPFHRSVINAWKLGSFELSQIGNMDMVPLTFDLPSNKTVETRGAKNVTIKTSGHKNMHYTLVLLCCADGTKLSPFLIFKRKTLPKENFPTGVHGHVYPKGWMDEGMKMWIEKNII